MSDSDAVVTYQVVDAVAVVTIDRPEVRNAMSLDVFDRLGEQAERAGSDPDVRAVMVTGAHGSFSSGIDVSTFAGGGAMDDAFIASLQASFTAFEELDKPVLAAIEGHCYGAGIQLAAACHLRAVAPSARLSVLERKWGLVPDLGGCVRLPRIVGLGHATELAMTARTFDAGEALRVGFASFVLDGSHHPESDDPYTEALAIARGLANAPHATGQVPRLMRENLGRTTEDGLAAERATQLRVVAHPDTATTMQARLQGREPDYLA